MWSITNWARCFALSGAVLLAGCRNYQYPPAPRTESARIPAEQISIRTNSTLAPEIRATAPAVSNDAPLENILAWDAKAKTYHAQPGEESTSFTFNVTNVSLVEIVIEDTGTSCGCTVAELPADPWKLAPGAHGQIQVTMDFNGMVGDVTKEVMIFTSKGNELLTVEAVIPEPVFPAAAK